MIGTKFYKPLEADKLFRTVMRTMEREVTEQVAVPVEREVTYTVQEPVYDDMGIVTGYIEKTVTETVQDIEYQPITKTVTEEVPKQEEYDNPAPNTMTKYRIAAMWCNANRAKIVDKGEYYEVEVLPEPTLEEFRATAISRIDTTTSAAIFAGFNYTINGETLHFSYLTDDQQNFADTANGALLAMQGIEGLPTTIKWNGWRNHTSEYKGDLVRLELDASAFLALYTSGALVHKSTQMEIGGQRKEIIKGCETVDEIKAYLAEWGM